MNARIASALMLLSVFFCVSTSVRAQENDDPYGDAGNFNGFAIEQAVEPFNGHAYREVQDVQINGALGRPLELRRYYNTERPGQWKTNYDGIIYGTELLLPGKFPTHYPMSLPSGNFVDFKYTTTDTYWRGASGTRERVTPLSASNPSTVTLTLPDGGKLVWTASLYADPVYKGYNRYYYALSAIIDPYTIKQTVTYEYDTVANGIPQIEAMIITDPVGRSLRIDYLDEGTYLGDGNHLIDKVTPSDGRPPVTYKYTTGVFGPVYSNYKYLSGVSYYGDATIGTAAYTMTTTYNFTEPPALMTAYDPMYPGALKNVRYGYRNVFGSAAGQIEKVIYPGQSGPVDMTQACKEQHPGSTGAKVGDVTNPYSWTCVPGGAGVEILTYCQKDYGSGWVSYLGNAIDAYSWACVTNIADVATLQYPDDNTRVLTRGDGKSQTSTYNDGVRLTQTDWKGKVMSWTYDDNNYLQGYISPGGTTLDRISYENDPLTGKVLKITYPVDGSGTTSTRAFTYEASYYLKTSTDERVKQTIYTRDPTTHRIKHIAHPDGGYEDWTWNTFGEPLTHIWLVSTGATATESWKYDTRGLMTEYRDPVHRTGNPTYRYVFGTHDRLWKVIDALGVDVNDTKHTTTYVYNNRGMSQWKEHGTFDQAFVTQITYPDGKTLKYAYDADGNRTSMTNELEKKWTYEFDAYRRSISMTDPLQHKTTYGYAPLGSGLSSFLTTWDRPWVTTTPSGRVITHDYDENFRPSETGLASGTSEAAYTNMYYEDDGDLLEGYDSLLRRTFHNTHDRRHRLIDVQNIWFQDTTYSYDPAGNKTKETRSDKKSRTWDTYDAMNRLLQMTGFDGDITTYKHNYVGNISQITDAKGAIYTLGWDLMGRKASISYPPDALGVVRTEKWDYDTMGNLWHHTMPTNSQVNTLTYDSRNRVLSSTWNVTGHDTTYLSDAAGRVTSITNPVSTIINMYDNANNLISQSQTIAGEPIRVVETPVDVDDRRASLTVGKSIDVGYHYTGRNQLKQITSGGWLSAPVWYQFEYDLADNRTWIENLLQGVGQGGLFTQNIYDPAKNRVTRQIQWGETALSDTSISYTEVNDKIQFTSDAMNAGHGDRFEYNNGSQQLINATYDATDPGNVDPTDYASQEIFSVDALKRLSVTIDGIKTKFSAADSGLNQYTAVGSKKPTWETNFRLASYNGITFTHDVEGNLASMSGNGHTATLSYDGLHRLVKQVVDGVTTSFTYDGWNPVVEWNTNNQFQAANLFGPEPNQILLRDRGHGTFYQYAMDTRHNPVLLIDASNNVLEKYAYNAFGKPTVTNAQGKVVTKSKYGNTLLFGGNRYFADFGVSYMQMRWYMPELGQFLMPDPLGFDGGDNNLYRYVGGDPVNFSDPSGLVPLPHQMVGDDPFDIGFDFVVNAGELWLDRDMELHPGNYPGLFPPGLIFAASPNLFPPEYDIPFYLDPNSQNPSQYEDPNGNTYDTNGNVTGQEPGYEPWTLPEPTYPDYVPDYPDYPYDDFDDFYDFDDFDDSSISGDSSVLYCKDDPGSCGYDIE